MVLSTDASDAKLMLSIPFSMKYVPIDQLAFNLVDICLDFTLQIQYLLCFANIGKGDY